MIYITSSRSFFNVFAVTYQVVVRWFGNRFQNYNTDGCGTVIQCNELVLFSSHLHFWCNSVIYCVIKLSLFSCQLRSNQTSTQNLFRCRYFIHRQICFKVSIRIFSMAWFLISLVQLCWKTCPRTPSCTVVVVIIFISWYGNSNWIYNC